MIGPETLQDYYTNMLTPQDDDTTPLTHQSYNMMLLMYYPVAVVAVVAMNSMNHKP